MSLIERFVPLGEAVLPVAFVADPRSSKFYEGSIRVGDPPCPWHGTPVAFQMAPRGAAVGHAFARQECPGEPRLARSSLDEPKRAVGPLASSIPKSGRMPLGANP